MLKKVLITGKNSYIGNSFCSYVEHHYSGQFAITRISVRNSDWKTMDWSDYDVVLNVAGKAHADVAHMSASQQQEYYAVNCELACQIAEKAIAEGVAQYIYLSSVIVYGDSSNAKQPLHITGDTPVSPSNFYGRSKCEAEKKLTMLFAQNGSTGNTKLAILRLPMIYGAGCKGNYRTLEALAQKLPFFPKVKNERSMLYIENLSEFFCSLMESGKGGMYFPQNAAYVSTAELVQAIGSAQGKHIYLCAWLNPFVWLARRMPGKIGKMVRKAFGTLTIDQSLSRNGIDGYQRFGMEESVKRSL